MVKPFLVFREKIGQSEIKVDGESVGEILQKFLSMFGDQLKELGAVSNDPLKLHPSIAILLNGRNIRFLRGEETKVKEKDVLMIIPPVAGG